MEPTSRLPSGSPATTPPPGIAAAIDYIHAHLDARLSLHEIAAQARLSIWHFSTVFRRHVGTSPRRYVSALRVRRVQSMLRDGVPVASAATAAGFFDQSHLSRHFKNACGMTPGQYLAQTRANSSASTAD